MRPYNKHLILFLVMFIGVFWYIYKSSGFRGLKGLILSIKLAFIIMVTSYPGIS